MNCLFLNAEVERLLENNLFDVSKLYWCKGIVKDRERIRIEGWFYLVSFDGKDCLVGINKFENFNLIYSNGNDGDFEIEKRMSVWEMEKFCRTEDRLVNDSLVNRDYVSLCQATDILVCYRLVENDKEVREMLSLNKMVKKKIFR